MRFGAFSDGVGPGAPRVLRGKRAMRTADHLFFLEGFGFNVFAYASPASERLMKSAVTKTRLARQLSTCRCEGETPMSIAHRCLTIALLVSCCGLMYAASNRAVVETASLDGQPFQTNLNQVTNLRLHLRDGDFRIVASDSDDITIQTNGKNRELAKKMKVRLQRTGDSLDITFLNVPKNEFQVTIAVPKETNLYARMRAGDLSVDGVAGNKDLELVAGDLSIQVPDASDYGPVDLSVRFGDVSGRQFGDPKGLMGNSLKRDGSGKYRLHAHVFAGDLMLKR
jgi:hypothetical protein